MSTAAVERDLGRGRPVLTVIWLHGLGADGHDFGPIVDELELAFDARFVFPHAPMRPVTVNGGLPMRAWFDIVGFERGAPWDLAGIEASAEIVEDLIRREGERGTTSERIVLGGFSQGGAMALHVGLRFEERLAGLFALSAFLPLAEAVQREQSAANASVPIFMAHGSADPLVPLAGAAAGRRHLEALGRTVEWRVYQMAHTVCMQEVRDIAAWLTRLAALR